MNDISLIVQSIKPEQYVKYFKDLPLPSVKEEYIDLLTSNVYQKKLLNNMIKNNLNISHITGNSITFMVDLNNGKIIKYLRNLGTQINVKTINSDVLSVELPFSNDRDIQVLNQKIDNYYLINKSGVNEKTNDYIIKLYQESPKEYLDYIKEENKNEINILKEKYLQETTLPFYTNSDVTLIDKKDITVQDIYNNDNVFNKIPLERLTQEQKQVMCNKYFREVFKMMIYDLNNKLSQIFGVEYICKYENQREYNLGRYGVTGNTLPNEDNKPNEIKVSMYPNVDFCKINGDVVKLNEALLGEVMITTLHEHEHILQQLGMVDENLYIAIKTFDSIHPQGSDSYMENYNQDPAEIDANLSSFNRLIEFSNYYGITNPKEIIMNRVNYVQNNAEESHNMFGHNSFSDYNMLQEYLNQLLQEKINYYCNEEEQHKSL